MAKLTSLQKTFIIQRLACFDTPSQVSRAIKEELGVTVTPQAVEKYDPTKRAGVELSKPLRQLFEQIREQFLHDTTAIAIRHKAFRLRSLQRMFDEAEVCGNLPLALQLLEQAAKEVGHT